VYALVPLVHRREPVFDLVAFCSCFTKNWFTIRRIDAERLGFIVPGCCKRQWSRRSNNSIGALS
jgi:hypothetical protein